MERSALEQLTAQARGDAQAAVFGSLPPARDYCNVPMSLARERACPLAMSRPINLAEKRSERNAAAELSAFGDVVRSLEKQASEKKVALAATEAATKAARRSLFQESSSYEAKRAQLVEERAALTQAERLISQT